MEDRQWARRYVDSSLRISYQDEPTRNWVVQFYYLERSHGFEINEPVAVNLKLPTSSFKNKDQAVVVINPAASQAKMQKLLKAYADHPEQELCPHRFIIKSLRRILYKDLESRVFEFDVIQRLP